VRGLSSTADSGMPSVAAELRTRRSIRSVKGFPVEFLKTYICSAAILIMGCPLLPVPTILGLQLEKAAPTSGYLQKQNVQMDKTGIDSIQ